MKDPIKLAIREVKARMSLYAVVLANLQAVDEAPRRPPSAAPNEARRPPGRPPKRRPKRPPMSAAQRRKLAAHMRRRWKAVRRLGKSRLEHLPPAKPIAGSRTAKVAAERPDSAKTGT